MIQNYGITAPDKWFQQKINQGGGIFDRASYEAALRHVDNFECAIDCGAHVGSWTHALAGKFEKVMAFEANPDNYEYLKKNCGALHNIDMWQCAVGDKFQKCAIQNGRENSGQSHIKKGEDISMVKLDTVCAKLSKIDFIKFDIEGYEYFALQGARNIIKKHKPVICIELNGLSDRYGINDNKVLKFIRKLGYIEAEIVNKDYIFKAI